MDLNELGRSIAAKQPILTQAVAFGELTLTVDLGALVGVIQYLKDDADCRFTSLVDITAVDHPESVARFEVVYHFLSMHRNQRIRVKVAVTEADMVPSVIGVHPSAN